MFVYIVDTVYILIIKGALLMELQKNMVITNEEYTYRVLALTDEQVLVINMSSKNMPSWKNIGDFEDWISIENLTHDTSLSAKAEQVANRRYGIIAPIIPFIGNEKLRAELITETAIANNVSKATIRKYLCNYLAAQDISALAPKDKVEKKALSYDEKNFRKSLNKWYFSTKKRTLKNCYTLMLEKYYCDEEGKLLDNVPSYYQFRYFYRKYKKPSTEMISRNSLSYYQRNQRPLIGDGVQGFAGTIGMGMLDSTFTNCYLVNDANEIIGRAVLTICVDAFSGLICGYSLSWKGGIYSIRDLMLNIITDKVEHCKKYGIDIEQFQWDCKQLPLTFVTDKGSEYVGVNFENISELGISIVNLKSYRADSKGPVEVAFNAIDNLYAVVVNAESNKEKLANCPHMNIPNTDLAVMCRISMGDNASVLVTNEMCSMLEATPSEVVDRALRNVSAIDNWQVRSMQDVLIESMGIPEELAEDFGLTGAPEMLVISDKSNMSALGPFVNEELRAEIANRLRCEDGEGYYIIPSSRFETIAIRADMDWKSVEEMVSEVNATQVDKEDQLSDHVYKVDGETLRISIAGQNENITKTLSSTEKVSPSMKM